LATHFAPNEDQRAVIQVLSSLVATTSINRSDDGLSQQVVIKDGIATQSKVEIKPLRTLNPVRTFSEIEPCDEMFLIRLRKNGNDFEALLKEADGQRWKEEALGKIYSFLTFTNVKIIF
jgi:hypothetical protein